MSRESVVINFGGGALGSQHAAVLSLKIYWADKCIPNVTIWQRCQSAADVGLYLRIREAALRSTAYPLHLDVWGFISEALVFTSPRYFHP